MPDAQRSCDDDGLAVLLPRSDLVSAQPGQGNRGRFEVVLQPSRTRQETQSETLPRKPGSEDQKRALDDGLEKARPRGRAQN